MRVSNVSCAKVIALFVGGLLMVSGCGNSTESTTSSTQAKTAQTDKYKTPAKKDVYFRHTNPRIWCLFTPAADYKPGPYVRCDEFSLNDSKGKIEMVGNARAEVGHAYDTVGSQDSDVLVPGKSITLGDIVCKSTTKTISCRNPSTTHGFVIGENVRKVY